MAHFMKRLFGQGNQPGAGPSSGGNSSQRTVDAIQNLGEVGLRLSSLLLTSALPYNSIIANRMSFAHNGLNMWVAMAVGSMVWLVKGP